MGEQSERFTPYDSADYVTGLEDVAAYLWRIIGRRNPETSVAATTGQTMGLVAAVSWFRVAAESFRMFTSIGAAIPEVTEDSQLQASIIHGTGLDITGALLLFVVGYTGGAAIDEAGDDPASILLRHSGPWPAPATSANWRGVGMSREGLYKGALC
jgi:hypothetical protein